MPKRGTKDTSTSLDLTRVTRTIYFVLGFYALSIVIFDSGNLLTRDAVVDRWLIFTFVLVTNTFAWYIAAQKDSFFVKPPVAIVLLGTSLLLFAGLSTYWERGMASTSTILYVLPLLVVATLKNRHLLMTTAVLAVGTYAFAAVKYFNEFFNEGYRVQLWGHILLYGGIIFGATWLIMILTGLRHDSR